MDRESFLVNKKHPFLHCYNADKECFEPEDIVKAAIDTNKALVNLNKDFQKESSTSLLTVIDKKQTSAFVGAIFIEKLVRNSTYLAKNPSQTGHPDVIPKKFIKEGIKWDQRYWDQFKGGGIEVKASCGNLKNGKTHELGTGEQRIDFLTGVCWKGHHDEINNLLGLFWDYINGVPHIVAAFFSNNLTPSDFTNTVPKQGGGHTTNVCITKSSASVKLGQGWVFCKKEDKYKDFVIKYFKIDFSKETIESINVN